jgi:hypothetical protein
MDMKRSKWDGPGCRGMHFIRPCRNTGTGNVGAPQKVYESSNAGLSKGETAVGTLGSLPSDFPRAVRSYSLISDHAACPAKLCKSEVKHW